MFAYKFELRPTLGGLAPLEAAVITPWLPRDAIVRSFDDTSQGHLLDVGFRQDRDSHHVALDELNEALAVAQQLGYSVVAGEITQVTDRAIEIAIIWGLGGLGVGASVDNGEVAAIASLIGWLGGVFVGSRMEKVEPIFQVQRAYWGWQLVEIPRPRPLRPAIEAG